MNPQQTRARDAARRALLRYFADTAQRLDQGAFQDFVEAACAAYHELSAEPPASIAEAAAFGAETFAEHCPAVPSPPQLRLA